MASPILFGSNPLRVLFRVLVLLVLPFYLFIGITNVRNARIDSEDALRNGTRLLAETVSATMMTHTAMLLSIGEGLLSLRALEEPERGRDLIERMIRIDSGMAGFGLARTDGQLVLVSRAAPGAPLPNLNADEQSRNSFQEALRSNAIHAGRAYFFKPLGQWVIPIRIALRDASGAARAVMTAGYRIEEGNAAWARMSPGPGMSVLLLHDDGYRLYQHPLEGDDLSTLYRQTYGEPVGDAVLQTLVGLPGESGIVELGIDGHNMLGAWQRLDQYGLYALTLMPAERVMASQMASLLTPTLWLLGFLFAGYWIYRHTRGLQQEAEALQRRSADELRDSERRFRELLRGIKLVGVMLDDRGVVTFANDYLLQLTGWERDEVVGRSWFERFLPPGSSVGAMFSQSLLVGEVPEDYENEILTRSGEHRMIAWKNTMLRDREGAVIGTASIGEDITDRKRQDTVLRTLSRAVEQSTSSVVITDRAGAIEYVNPRFEAVSGYSRAEAMGSNPRMLKSGTVRPEVYRQLWAAISAGGEWRGELCNRRKDGELYWEYATISGLRDESGQVSNYIAVKDDITEKKRAWAAANATREQYERIFVMAPEGVWLTDTQRRTVDVNPRMCAMLGYAPGEMQGRPPSDFTDAASNLWLLQNWSAIRSRPDRSYEVLLRHKDGHGVPVYISATSLRNADGSLRGSLAFVTDLTERRRIEADLRRLNDELERRVEERTHALQVANRELESFSYSVSHDLRTPLRSINGFSQLIEESQAERMDDQGRQLLQRVRAASARMGQLIEDLLKLSRISRRELQVESVDLSAMAHAIREELSASEPGRQLEWRIATDLRVRGDAGLLRVALQNLLGNAWKYSARRDAACIELGVMNKEGRSAYFVRDNGAGFDMAYADKLFGPFQRLHTEEEFPGSGIGLATVARIIHRHGGEIRAEGKVGEGATFYFTLA